MIKAVSNPLETHAHNARSHSLRALNLVTWDRKWRRYPGTRMERKFVVTSESHVVFVSKQESLRVDYTCKATAYRIGILSITLTNVQVDYSILIIM